MNERATPWHPVADLDAGFESISFSFPQAHRGAQVVLHGRRKLYLQFSGVIAFHFEDDCPGNFPLPRDLPMLNDKFRFPLLKIEHSAWLAQWPMWPNLTHFVLLSLDDLVQVIAQPAVAAHWD